MSERIDYSRGIYHFQSCIMRIVVVLVYLILKKSIIAGGIIRRKYSIYTASYAEVFYPLSFCLKIAL